MGCNPKIMGVYPPNHPLKNRVFYYKPSNLGGLTSLFLEIPIYLQFISTYKYTLLGTNIFIPKKGTLEDYFPFPKVGYVSSPIFGNTHMDGSCNQIYFHGGPDRTSKSEETPG